MEIKLVITRIIGRCKYLERENKKRSTLRIGREAKNSRRAK
jgi:hypothetical protein